MAAQAEVSYNATRSGAVQSDRFCRLFSLDEVLTATNNFDDALVIGNGGFGKVYRGLINNDNNCTEIVALKRLNAESKQGAGEFWTEIKMLSKLRHNNLVSLIGYCNELLEMILVYEYIDGGTLANNLYKLSSMSVSPLTWEQRLKICIGAARGLNYLHAGTNQSFIHRDVKTTNILLNGNWVAKICDFGLSKGTISHSITHVSTDVKGTFGYFDPEYFLTQRLTTKSDVYAFGVVLLEVLCGRPPVDTRLVEEQIGLVEWAEHCIKKGKLDVVIDPSLSGQIAPRSLKSFVQLASKCLHKGRKSRPTMAEVLGSLELTLVSQQKGGTEGIISKAFLLMDGWLRFRKDDGSLKGQSKDMTREPDENNDSYSHSSLIVEGYRNTASQDVHAPLSVSQRDLRSTCYTEETTTKQVTFSDPFSSTEVDDLQVEGQQNESEPNANRVSKNSTYSISVDDPTSSYSPYLPPVLEEPSSSDSEAGEDDPLPGIEDLQITGDAFPGKELQACGISINGTTSCNFKWVRHQEDGSMDYIEGATHPKYLVTADDIDTVLGLEIQPLDDRKRKGEIVRVFANGHRKITCVNSLPYPAGEDDPLPGIEDLQITGDAFPGKELQACGISINGTTSCNFEWVRHQEDGSMNYIGGATQPKYLVTADDIDTVLGLETQPLDDRKRKGEIVRVFANGHRKITCDPKMQNSIVKTLHNGHASFRVSLWTRYLDIWELATLTIKSEGYSIKGSEPNGVLVTEKFLPTTRVTIAFGNATGFSIIRSGGVELRLQEENNAEDEDVSCSRDAIVLTLRLFIMKAAERKKGKRRNLNLFF
ncbi:receptor-like kinase LIP2 [Rhododendron vialii]|uniref:receptor-like kinase LIP2 n=1 Tax=Rhododendron vialii TaxID=182163 RepID=UPI00265E1D5E|nr:receptor-like kinase LIP2 [Rhododendron vialii]